MRTRVRDLVERLRSHGIEARYDHTDHLLVVDAVDHRPTVGVPWVLQVDDGVLEERVDARWRLRGVDAWTRKEAFDELFWSLWQDLEPDRAAHGPFRLDQVGNVIPAAFDDPPGYRAG
ncbi:hypothetical protein [Aeromicrobium massiliense]|uniref:hypothetical protein n=1 Tax=Aeromicrobium massiliense TaxID=1464554 RepID=UPI00030612A9|nr:hypothetical protein [Aeromicrobium massiliense]